MKTAKQNLFVEFNCLAAADNFSKRFTGVYPKFTAKYGRPHSYAVVPVLSNIEETKELIQQIVLEKYKDTQRLIFGGFMGVYENLDFTK